MKVFFEKIKRAFSVFLKGLWGYIFKILIAIDQGVNVVCGPFFNAVTRLEMLVRRIEANRGWRYGFPDETLSSVIGKNRRVSRFAQFHAWWLNALDKGHTDKAFEDDEGRRFKV